MNSENYQPTVNSLLTSPVIAALILSAALITSASIASKSRIITWPPQMKVELKYDPIVSNSVTKVEALVTLKNAIGGFNDNALQIEIK